MTLYFVRVAAGQFLLLCLKTTEHGTACYSAIAAKRCQCLPLATKRHPNELLDQLVVRRTPARYTRMCCAARDVVYYRYRT